jgi:hypothetical protein
MRLAGLSARPVEGRKDILQAVQGFLLLRVEHQAQVIDGTYAQFSRILAQISMELAPEVW